MAGRAWVVLRELLGLLCHDDRPCPELSNVPIRMSSPDDTLIDISRENTETPPKCEVLPLL